MQTRMKRTICQRQWCSWCWQRNGIARYCVRGALGVRGEDGRARLVAVIDVEGGEEEGVAREGEDREEEGGERLTPEQPHKSSTRATVKRRGARMQWGEYAGGAV